MKLTRDDERARRICSLALEFMNATAPITSTEVARGFYPQLSPDSFRRAFARDRAALATCGVVVREVRAATGESSWEADQDRSFAGGTELEPLETAALEVACQPLLESADFPLAGELRIALAKLTRAFAEASVVSAPPREEGRAFEELQACLVDGCAAEVGYTDARGVSSRRTIAPYGLFSLRGVRYLVAGRLGERNEVVEGGERTYRVDRFSSVRRLPAVRVDVPPDFCVADWRRLPFQMGPEISEALFAVPAAREADLRRAAAGQGAFERRDGELAWRVGASSLEDAASWAVAMGLRPLEPEGLVRAWRDLLEEVLEDGR